MKIMNLIFRKLFAVWAVSCLMFGTPANAEDTPENITPIPYYAENYDYYVQNYDVFLTVDTSRNVNVQEIVTVRFNNTKIKSIKHVIPKFHGHISDIQVSVPYKEDDGLSKLQLKIATDSAANEPTLQYKVSYNYQIFSDESTFDFRLVPSEWKVPLQRVRFKLQLPDYVENKDVHLYID